MANLLQSIQNSILLNHVLRWVEGDGDTPSLLRFAQTSRWAHRLVFQLYPWRVLKIVFRTPEQIAQFRAFVRLAKRLNRVERVQLVVNGSLEGLATWMDAPMLSVKALKVLLLCLESEERSVTAPYETLLNDLYLAFPSVQQFSLKRLKGGFFVRLQSAALHFSRWNLKALAVGLHPHELKPAQSGSGIFDRLLSCCSALDEVDVCYSHFMDEGIIRDKFRGVGRVLKLRIDRPGIHYLDQLANLSASHRLKELHVAVCTQLSTHEAVLKIKATADFPDTLTSLDFRLRPWQLRFSSSAPAVYPKITSLTLSFDMDWSMWWASRDQGDTAVERALFGRVLQGIARTFPNTRNLSFRTLDPCEQYLLVPKDVWLQPLGSLAHLESLRIEGWASVSGAFLLGGGFSALSRVAFHNCPDLVRRVLDKAGNAIPTLPADGVVVT